MTSTSQQCIHREFREDHLVEIFDQGDIRSLYFGGQYLQSRLSLSSPHLLLLPYTQYMTLPLLFSPHLQRILLIGLGAGSLVCFFHHHFPNSTMDVVDHSPYIIELAHNYFKLPQHKNIRIHCQDGLDFIKQDQLKRQYDLILVDAFSEEGMSTRIYSQKFISHCRRALNFQGILSCNIWSGRSERVHHLTNILDACFPYSLHLPVPNRGNIIRYCLEYPVPYHQIFRKTKELDSLSYHYGINYKQMADNVARYNMSFAQRMYHYLRYQFSM